VIIFFKEGNMLNVIEVAQRFNVSIATVRKWVLQRRIPFVKVGSLVRFRLEDIEKIEKEGLA